MVAAETHCLNFAVDGTRRIIMMRAVGTEVISSGGGGPRAKRRNPLSWKLGSVPFTDRAGKHQRRGLTDRTQALLLNSKKELCTLFSVLQPQRCAVSNVFYNRPFISIQSGYHREKEIILPYCLLRCLPLDNSKPSYYSISNCPSIPSRKLPSIFRETYRTVTKKTKPSRNLDNTQEGVIVLTRHFPALDESSADRHHICER